jgi:hypothetical protein
VENFLFTENLGIKNIFSKQAQGGIATEAIGVNYH